MWVMMLVAGIIVGSCGGAFYLGGQNEPVLPENTWVGLTYSVQGTIDDLPIDGEFSLEVFMMEGYSHWSSYQNSSGQLRGFTYLPEDVLFGGFFLDRTIIETQWGAKHVNSMIDYVWTTPDRPDDVCIIYRGTNTGLAYKIDQLGPGLDVEFVLTSTNLTNVGDIDRRSVDNDGFLLKANIVDDGSYFLTNGNQRMLLEANDSQSYNVHFHGDNMTFLVFDDGNLRDMIEGGDYRFTEKWSGANGDGLDIELNGMMFFIMIVNNVEDYGGYEVTLT